MFATRRNNRELLSRYRAEATNLGSQLTGLKVLDKEMVLTGLETVTKLGEAAVARTILDPLDCFNTQSRLLARIIGADASGIIEPPLTDAETADVRRKYDALVSIVDTPLDSNQPLTSDYSANLIK